jgi:hypothetical protein
VLKARTKLPKLSGAVSRKRVTPMMESGRKYTAWSERANGDESDCCPGKWKNQIINALYEDYDQSQILIRDEVSEL